MAKPMQIIAKPMQTKQKHTANACKQATSKIKASQTTHTANKCLNGKTTCRHQGLQQACIQ
jgi:hypothetical protein